MNSLISIIIVNYNVRDYLDNCLNSIYKSKLIKNIEIIVVDNDSSDNSAQMVIEKYPNINLIQNKTNFGFSKAVNQGIKISSGEYLLLLNPDTVLEKNTLNILINYMENNKSVGMCGPKILNSDGTLQLSCKRSFPTPIVAFPKLIGLDKLFPKNKWVGRYNLTYLDENQCHSVDAISGSFMFIRKQILNEVGFLDEEFFMFGEDLDLCFRIKKHNYQIHYVPTTQIIHFKGESVKSVPLESIKWFYNAMDLFVNKHFSSKTSFLFTFLLKTGIFLRKISSISKSGVVNIFPLILDIFIILLSFIIGISLRFSTHETIFHNYIPILIIYLIIWIFIIFLFDLYTKFVLSYNRALIASFLGFLVSVTFTFFLKDFAYSRAVLIYSSFLICILVPGWRLILNILRSKGYISFLTQSDKPIFSRPAIIVGIDKEGIRILNKINKRPDTGIYVIGFVETKVNTINIFELKKNNINHLGPINKLKELIKLHKIRELIFTSEKLEIKEMLEIMDSLKSFRLTYRVVPKDKDILLGKASVEDISDIPFLNIEYSLYHRINFFSKRIFDIFFSGILIIMFSPILILSFVFFKSNQLLIWGLENKKIKINLINSNIGFFRKLPLLFNIFLGQISFVGSDIISVDKKAKKIICKPGLTGIYRMKKFKLSVNDNNIYDHYYVQNQSFAFDLEILIRTIFF